MKLIIFTLIASCFYGALGQDKYCNPQLCTRWDGKGYTTFKHIACPLYMENKCKIYKPGTGPMTITSELKNYILEKHNAFRDDLAGGRIRPFKTAKRMPFFQWDDELAYLAKKNAERCIYAHDKCRNTEKYKRAGQNIAKYPSKKTVDDKAAWKWALDAWWNEYENTTLSNINSYGHSEFKIGHFTAMAQERSDRIGCAAHILELGNGWITRILVCNYACTNIDGLNVYTAGATASGCKTGTHEMYTNLCSENEAVNPN